MFGLDDFNPPQQLLEELAAKMTEDLEPPDAVSLDSGYTLLGQFISHDISHDKRLLYVQPGEPAVVENFRTPRFDLDTVYATPPGSPAPPRDPADEARMDYREDPSADKIDDLPRQPDSAWDKGFANIGDRRNDENLLLTQLHLAFLKLHNVFVDQIDTVVKIRPREPVYEEARDRCRWYFQWLIVNDFLPRIVGKSLVDKILKLPPGGTPEFDLRFYKPPDHANPMIPFEFAAGAFRFSHSMVRPVYKVRDISGLALFSEDPLVPTLVGFRPIPGIKHKVDWRRFFRELPGLPSTSRNHAKQIDARLPKMMRSVPVQLLPPEEQPPIQNLALRDLMRSARHKVPSGQFVAEAIRSVFPEVPVLSNADLGLDEDGWEGKAPLLYYVLKEAERTETKLEDGTVVRGEQLGPVGGRIVAEVILGLLKYDPSSYLRNDPHFVPTPRPDGTLGSTFKMADLLRLARVAD